MALDLQARFGTDKAAESDGKWFDVGDGARLKVARSNNPTYRRELARLLTPHRAAVRAGTIQPEILDPAICRALARGVLKDWEGLVIGGKVVKYSEEAAEKVLLDYPDFRDLVSELAEQREAYLAEEVEEGKGTSGK